MRRRGRAVRILIYIGTGISILSLAMHFVGLWWLVEFRWGDYSIVGGEGCLGFGFIPGSTWDPSGVFVQKSDPLVKYSTPLPGEMHGLLGRGFAVWVPFWMMFIGFAVPTAILWHRSCRSKPGHCQHCGYDLTGNVSGRCPECGADVELKPADR